MTMVDPEQERQRLAEFYAGQHDGELAKVAREAYDLTDLAREVLRNEILKRGLNLKFVEERPALRIRKPEPMPGDPPPVPPKEVLPAGELDMRPMVTLRQFRDVPEALLAKGSLESAGIECAFADDNLVRLDWFYSNAIGGIKLLVDPDDLEDAEKVLTQPIPENFEAEGTGPYEQPKCPKCGSLDVNFREMDPAAYLTLAVNVPIPIRRRAWRCHACDAEWEADEAASPEQSPA
ncbi:MAG TPA: DUF2007 domain-containing protein [Candidatus Sulfotelmatobacter sp.]|nr:DUF2007 domain-containing protein [Candidatus Sulfotelmatobacter sp.]